MPLDSSSISNHYFYETIETQRIKKLRRTPFRFFYFGFIPKKIRLNLEKKADISQKKNVADSWSNIISDYLGHKIPEVHLKPNKMMSHTKIIWQYWAQGWDNKDLPPIVKLCTESVDQFKGDYQVIRLDDKNIHQYLDLPDFVWQKKNNKEFKLAFFADLLRLALLDLYGGIWLDATILLTDEIPQQIKNQNFFMYQRSPYAQNQDFWKTYNKAYFDWSDSHRVNVLNSFIVSKKDNYIIHTCLNLLLFFWKSQDTIPHYFFFQIMFDVLISQYMKDHNCMVIDDTFPHLLQSVWKKLDNSLIEKIKKETSIHKLTYFELNSFFK